MFDRLLPDNEELSSYGESKLQALTAFYGRAQSISFEGETNRSVPDIDGDEAKAEWRFFVKYCSRNIYTNISMDKVFSNLPTNDTIGVAFPNLKLVSLASLAIILSVTVQRSFSDMKLIKTHLRNRHGEESLDQTNKKVTL